MPAATKPVAPLAPQSGRAVPFALPAAHFICGLGFVVAAAALLPVIAPHLAAGRFLHPHVVAVAHLITLGWLTLSIMGALCQLFPVALGTPLFSVRIATVALAMFVPGVALFVIGLLAGRTTIAIGAAVVFALALLLFVYNGYRTLFRARDRDLTWWTLAAAFGFLVATVAFGASLAVNLRSAHLGEGRMVALAVHVHVAVAGWVGLVIMAVGRRLLPMFLLSHGATDRALRIATMASAAGAGLLSLFHRAMTPTLFAAAAVLLMIGFGAFLVQLTSYLRTRHRPQLDAGLRLALAGMLLVTVAVAMGALLLVTPGTQPKLPTAYGVALLGGLLLFVAGHYYKILPFLLWNHRFAPHAGKRPLPKIADLYDMRIANIAMACSVSGVVGVMVGVLLGSTPLAVGAALLLTAGCLTEAIQLIALLRTRVT